MEASADAERRDAKEARKAMAESQRELGSLRQEAAKVRRAAPHTPRPLAPRHPHMAPRASLRTLAPCALHPRPVSRAFPPPCKAAETAQKQRTALAERLAAALGELKARRQQAEAAQRELEAVRRGAAEAAARAMDAAAARAEAAEVELARMRGEEGALQALSLDAMEVGRTPCCAAQPAHPRHHPCHLPTPPTLRAHYMHAAVTGARAASAAELGARAVRQGCADGAAAAGA